MIIFIIISLTVLITVIIFTLLIIRKKNSKLKILTTLQQHGNVIIANKECYDYKLSKNNITYLIKVIYNYNKLEISVNNKNHWEVNDKVVSSKKGGTKLQGIYDLINVEYKDESIRKIYLIYPTAKVLLKAVNESELTFIYPNTNCYGVNLIKFDEFNNAI